MKMFAFILLLIASTSEACTDWDAGINAARASGDYDKMMALVGAQHVLGDQCVYVQPQRSYARPIDDDDDHPISKRHTTHNSGAADPLDPVGASLILPGAFPR